MKKKRTILLISSLLLIFLLIISICVTKREQIAESETSLITELPFTLETEIDERMEQAIQRDNPTIIVSNVMAKPGDKVTVTASIVNNPGILGMSMMLSYDDRIMKLINVENGEAVRAVLNMSNSNSFENGCVFLWDGENITLDQIHDGDILVLEFQVAENAPAGKTPILLTSDEGGTVNNDLQVLDVTIENGFIIIE